MKSVCAWCGADLGRRPGPADLMTHGMCAVCAGSFRAGIAATVQAHAVRVIEEAQNEDAP